MGEVHPDLTFIPQIHPLDVDASRQTDDSSVEIWWTSSRKTPTRGRGAIFGKKMPSMSLPRLMLRHGPKMPVTLLGFLDWNSPWVRFFSGFGFGFGTNFLRKRIRLKLYREGVRLRGTWVVLSQEMKLQIQSVKHLRLVVGLFFPTGQHLHGRHDHDFGALYWSALCVLFVVEVALIKKNNEISAKSWAVSRVCITIFPVLVQWKNTTNHFPRKYQGQIGKYRAVRVTSVRGRLFLLKCESGGELGVFCFNDWLIFYLLLHLSSFALRTTSF